MMSKYSVILRWGHYIQFPDITARDKEEAQVIAESILASPDNRLLEEADDGAEKWEIEEKDY